MNRVFLDACVLYPPLVRRLLLGIARAGYLVPLWSERVLEEWRISVARKQGLAEEGEVIDARATMTERFPEALVEASPDYLSCALPDPADEHVLAAALAGRADVILTFNLRDFPRRVLEPLSISAEHPDSALWRMLSQEPAIHEPLTHILTEQGVATADDGRRALKRARLPRLGKAWAQTV